MDKHCQQQLQKFGMQQVDITHVCIAPGLFPLLQYLLVMGDDVVFNHTYYFVSEIIPKETRQQLPCSCFDYYGKLLTQKIRRRCDKIKLRLCKYKDFPFLKSAELFAYDMPYLSLCIGERPYSLLSDAPNWLNLNMQPTSEVYRLQQQKASSLVGRIQRWFYGDLFIHHYGNNKQCKAIYLTEENSSPILEQLRKEGFKIGVATYKREDYAIDILRHFGISTYCDVIHGADNENKLTKADIVELCCKELAVNKGNILLVGDTEHDAKGAMLAEVQFCAVTWGFGYSNNSVFDDGVFVVRKPVELVV